MASSVSLWELLAISEAFRACPLASVDKSEGRWWASLWEAEGGALMLHVSADPFARCAHYNTLAEELAAQEGSGLSRAAPQRDLAERDLSEAGPYLAAANRLPDACLRPRSQARCLFGQASAEEMQAPSFRVTRVWGPLPKGHPTGSRRVESETEALGFLGSRAPPLVWEEGQEAQEWDRKRELQ